jgi:hypothetical protein
VVEPETRRRRERFAIAAAPRCWQQDLLLEADVAEEAAAERVVGLESSGCR